MRRRLLSDDGFEGLTSLEAQAGDVVFCKNDNKTLVIRRDLSDWLPDETPIGIVVVPGEHNVYGDYSCGVCSLMDMAFYDPEYGSEDGSGLVYGWTGENSDLMNFTHIGVSSTKFNTTYVLNNSSTWGAMPVQNKNTLKVEYIIGPPYCPSPYIGADAKSGNANPAYYIDPSGIPSNALTDFNGVKNTRKLTEVIFAYQWKVIATIPNSSTSGSYPAAACCARYKTLGTKSFAECTDAEITKGIGFWYMPACGELGYIIPKVYDIIAVINQLLTTYNLSLSPNFTTLSSSTQASDRSNKVFHLTDGRVHSLDKDLPTRTKAFMRLKIERPLTYNWVDMGTSVLWADRNLGATSPEDPGLYYAWGEVVGYTLELIEKNHEKRFNWMDYKHAIYDENNRLLGKLTKYCNDPSYGYNGYSDDKTNLEPEDDAAYITLGNGYRLPTALEFRDLNNACTVQTVSGGYLFTSKSTGNTLFFPITKCYYNYESDEDIPYLWSATISTTATNDIAERALCLKPSTKSMINVYKMDGCQIRPVTSRK